MIEFIAGVFVGWILVFLTAVYLTKDGRELFFRFKKNSTIDGKNEGYKEG